MGNVPVSSESSSLPVESELDVVRRKEPGQMRRDLATSWPTRWRRMIDQWRDPADEPADGAWLMHAANYLFRTGGTRWAVDPVQLHWMIPEAPAVDVADLASLDLVLLTHNHKDHADLSIWRALADRPIDWVMPPFLRDAFVQATGVEDHRLIVAQPGQAIHRHGLDILPMTGLHWEPRPDLPAGRLGIDAMAYQVRWKKSGHDALRTLLLPGDTRHYDASPLRSVASPDVLFAHVWLGRGSALLEQPPLLQAMARFVCDLEPRQRVVLAHLYEISRRPVECWTLRHAHLLMKALAEHRPDLNVIAPLLGDRIEL